MGLIKLKKNNETKSEFVDLEVKELKTNRKKYNNKKIIFEDENKKSEYSNTYLLNDGTYEQVISMNASNYYDVYVYTHNL